MGITLTCCSKEKDEHKEEIKTNDKPATYSYPVPFTVQTVPQQPLYSESISQHPTYVSPSRAPTVIG
jgi:hypothetical protein